MSRLYSGAVLAISLASSLVFAQNNCYYGPGAGFRGDSKLVPCNTTSEYSACCLLGDTCLTGNACYNYATGNTYQYGCTDINYQDESCPQKCNWSPSKSPWIGLEYCNDIHGLNNTWTCLAPESCGCEWNSTEDLAILPSRGCAAMGSDARIALFAPSTLLAYVSLPMTAGGSTGYYSSTTLSGGSVSIISTAIAGYTPDQFTLPTTYSPSAPSTASYINAAATAQPSTLPSVSVYTATTPYTPQAAGSNTGTTTTSGASTTTSTAPATSSASSSGGLSTGAQAGIGVGVAVGVCAIAGIGVCLYLMNRKKRNQNNAANAANQQQQQQPPQPMQQQQMGGQPPVYDHQYISQSPPMAQYMQPQPMQGNPWAPVYPQGQMPYFVPPQQHKDPMVGQHGTPPYSPPHSPPPTELSADAARQLHEADSVHSGASPRLHSPEVANTRFSEGPM